MAVYTQIDDTALEQFLARYEIGTLLSFAGIAEGVENSNYLLRTDAENYILTLYEKRVNEAELPYFIGLMQHLSAAGLQCPVPISDKDGHILQQLSGRPAAMVSFLNGTSKRFPNPKQCFALGKTLAQFHLLSADFELTRKNGLGPDDWTELLASIDTAPAGMPEDLLSSAADKLSAIAAQWPHDLPSGAIHADLFPNNVLFVGDRLTGVIDFYFACADILAYDLAICLNSWCFDADGSFNITKSRALIRGYQDIRPLSRAEIDAIPVLCAGSAMRFFLTRLYDWLHTPVDALVSPKDPMEYWAILRFHQSVSGPSGYGFD